MDGNILHLKSIGKPATPSNDKDPDGSEQEEAMDVLPDSTASKDVPTQSNAGHSQQQPDALVWRDHFHTDLASFLDQDRIQQLKDMYLQGRHPPRVSDSGWAGRNVGLLNKEKSAEKSVDPNIQSEADKSEKRRGRNKKSLSKDVDDRKVVSEVLVSESDNRRILTFIMPPLSP